MDKVNWEGLKSAYALILATGTFEEKHALRKQLGDVLLTAFPNLLAEHERDQRVIQAAEKMRYDFSEQNRAEYDKAKQS